ncbi:MAG: histidinol-phosphate transaminase [Schaalia hyovaginalis]|uniref:histidinol-phosphate transaminase n=1 Tax=Schaalia hyovaginalis TaxID=29316 RepID=UPI0026EE4CB2|nr:histidinol-phosphate transaminase [Schaalia hyovaginalis]MCI7512163.1 histidinol-phosphate transaminase [Schaalia hyovaginalis]MDY3664559.1 histidinol-phosphate transaminase [Schaalia hyovaginalis]MDY4261742.1 histidinol-phosphate transaminase [Schaalia hyovaginalis]MDY5601364.1 histidinol-phosphate transaminase [Schaalia hyovaginalis]
MSSARIDEGEARRLPLREDLTGLEPYGAPQLEVAARLNVNENPYAPSAGVIADIADSVARAAAGLNRYPDRDFTELRGALADYLAGESGVRRAPELIWAGNGSNEVMLHLFQAFGGPGRSAVSFAPTYSMYHEYARDTNTRWVQGARLDDFTLDLERVEQTLRRERPALLLLASPNNPTGTALPLEDVKRILEAAEETGPLVEGEASSTIVVIDEAYAEFRREGTPSALELLEGAPHLVVSRTMSKAFGMAGLRLGYMTAAKAIIDAVMLVRLPYHLSAVTQAAALAALRHADELGAQVASLREERDRLVERLRDMGLQAVDSDANFVLFGPFEDRRAVFDALLERGVLIRVVGPEGWLRVSIGTPEETAAFVTALEEVIS